MYPILVNNNFIKIKQNETVLCAVINGNRLNMELNESAYHILQLCTGMNTIEDINNRLSDIYIDTKGFVYDYIYTLVNLGIIVFNTNPKLINSIKGSYNLYYPDIIIWEITNICPLDCKHCYLGKKERNEVSLSDIDYILSIIAKSGVTTVQITGGEIFTHQHLEYIVDRLNDLNIEISMSSSGFILNNAVKSILRKIKSNGIVRISLDGDKDYHNMIRRNNLAYDKCLKFIQFLMDEGIRCQVGTVLLEQSESMIEDMIKLVKSMGVSLHSFSPVSEQGNAENNELTSKYTYKYLERKLVEWSISYASNTYKIQLPQESKTVNCGCGYKMIRIRPDLSVTPCPMIDFTIGNLNDINYDTIVERGTKLFSQLPSPRYKETTICKSCEHEEKCSDCLATALVMNKNLQNCRWVLNKSTKLNEFLRY